MVSVILPAFNAESTIVRALDSIFSSGLSNFEIVVVDDGSVDQTGAICDSYCAMYSNIICIHKVNEGVSAARNAGIKFAQGDFILFCDADDEFVPCVGARGNKNNADLLVYGFDIVQGGHVNSVCYRDEIMSPDNAFKYLLGASMPGALWNKIFRRSIIIDNNLSFREDIRFREDEEFLIRYLNFCNTVEFSSCIHYRYYSPDLSSKYIKADNFWCDVSMFNSANHLLGEENPYLSLLTNAFFNSFDNNLPDLYHRTVAYENALSSSGLRPENLSSITRVALKTPPVIGYLFFLLKSFFYTRLSR